MEGQRLGYLQGAWGHSESEAGAPGVRVEGQRPRHLRGRDGAAGPSEETDGGEREGPRPCHTGLQVLGRSAGDAASSRRRGDMEDSRGGGTGRGSSEGKGFREERGGQEDGGGAWRSGRQPHPCNPVGKAALPSPLGGVPWGEAAGGHTYPPELPQGRRGALSRDTFTGQKPSWEPTGAGEDGAQQVKTGAETWPRHLQGPGKEPRVRRQEPSSEPTHCPPVVTARPSPSGHHATGRPSQ